MESVRTPVPELDSFRHDADAAPVWRTRDGLTLEALFHFVRARKKNVR
jgi:hypothetical protein